ncbi:hypothetical protein [Solitalea canadensis]|uniref:Uncharacterized protein n=1 Tax=Solitalea canadensis (strain ATCC 29591 / DSM 3403 / JCM 21819 / LMG 8368 / NBRC 15130 / NCIMB 12057 / USAM 9D) TaxID=929556 RepID=H8KTP9_SOLCM|nr:hypothetical protein [Solitalea canadensis]AFD06624.1 hypothetical protein Solca_1551 [Solitalea canadensis DSM 3403]
MGGSLDLNAGGTETMNVENFGKNTGGYRIGQAGIIPDFGQMKGYGFSAMYSYGTTWVF